MLLGELAHLGPWLREVGLAADTDGPSGRHRQGEPEPLRPCGRQHLGLFPMPATALAVFEAALDPSAQRIPRDIDSGRRQVGEDQPGIAIPRIPARAVVYLQPADNYLVPKTGYNAPLSRYGEGGMR
jgi:hypothetical protein